MKRASVTEAKNRLSALLKRVQHGETVIIEDRGVPIAQINPVSGRATTTDRDRLARLERDGILRPLAPGLPVRLLVEPPPRPRRDVTLSDLVRQERARDR